MCTSSILCCAYTNTIPRASQHILCVRPCYSTLNYTHTKRIYDAYTYILYIYLPTTKLNTCTRGKDMPRSVVWWNVLRHTTIIYLSEQASAYTQFIRLMTTDISSIILLNEMSWCSANILHAYAQIEWRSVQMRISYTRSSANAFELSTTYFWCV